MIQSPVVRRLFGLLAAVLQLSLLGVSVADEARGQILGDSHVESGSGDTCTPSHADDCAICRLMPGGGSVDHQPGGLTEAGRASVIPVGCTGPWQDTGSYRQPPTRAPPSI